MKNWIAAWAVAGLLGCEDEAGTIVTVPPPPPETCVVGEIARSFDVYFVIDVSRSMARFLEDLADQLGNFALGFPTEDINEDRVIVNYYVVAFVNDVRLFPFNAERMTSHIAVGAAIRDAIAAADGNRNLNANTPNADADENLLDALGAVLDRSPSADSRMVLIATDEGFREAGEQLSGGITVTRTYEQVFQGLEDFEVRVHAFTQGALDGLTRPYLGQPPLTSIGEGGLFELSDLAGADDLLATTLEGIARDASCNPTSTN